MLLKLGFRKQALGKRPSRPKSYDKAKAVREMKIQSYIGMRERGEILHPSEPDTTRWEPKFKKYGPEPAKSKYPKVRTEIGPGGLSMEKILQYIAKAETGHLPYHKSFKARGLPVARHGGARARGRWQIMPSNITIPLTEFDADSTAQKQMAADVVRQQEKERRVLGRKTNLRNILDDYHAGTARAHRRSKTGKTYKDTETYIRRALKE